MVSLKFQWIILCCIPYHASSFLNTRHPLSRNFHSLTSQQHEEGEGRILDPSSQKNTTHHSKTFVLPIFPLRKNIKFPTQTINLNLYEQRYVSLAKYVLGVQEEEQCFGALYCSHRPFFAPSKEGSIGPVTPIVNAGDIGVVCSVLSSNVQSNPEKIQLKGLAVGRFRVEKILQIGYSKPEDFILVEASRVDDVVPIPGSEGNSKLDALEQKLYKSILEVDGMVDFMIDDLWKNQNKGDEEEDQMYLTVHPFAPNSSTDGRSRVEQALYQWECGSSNHKMEVCSVEDRRRQHFSFAVASTLIMDRPKEDLMELLKTTSTYERLKYLWKVMEEGRGWLAVRKSLKDFFE